MSGDKYSPPNYCNKVERLIPFSSQQEAENWLNWLKENALDTNGIPILIPFKNAIGQIEFLKPLDQDEHFQDQHFPGDRLRIMGAANYVKSKKWFAQSFDWLKKQFSRDFVPHVKDLCGQTIKIENNGFIVIYERGAKSAGQAFAQLFREQKDNIREQIKITQTNDKPRLEPAKFIQDLSDLALDLAIRAGVSYFIEWENGVVHVYRHTFHSDAANDKLALYLKKEAELHQSQAVRVHNNKTQNNRYLPFLKDWTKGTIFATVTAIGVGFIASLFLVSFIAAAIAVITFVGLSAFTFYKALKDNKATMEFGKSEFREVESNNTLSDAQTRTVPALDKQNPMPTWQQNPEDKKSEAMASKFGSFFEPVKEACKTIPKEILKSISPSRTIANRG